MSSGSTPALALVRVGPLGGDPAVSGALRLALDAAFGAWLDDWCRATGFTSLSFKSVEELVLEGELEASYSLSPSLSTTQDSPS